MWWDFPCPPYVEGGLLKIPLEFLGESLLQVRGYLVWSAAFLFGPLDDLAKLLPCGVAQLKPFLWAENVVHHRHGFVLVPRGVA